jgi:exodeoxyribonuclease V alpha subunit
MEVVRVHGGMKVHRGAAAAARHYVEADRSRAGDYYLAEGSGVAMRFTATPDGIEHRDDMDGETYERWVAGYDVET